MIYKFIGGPLDGVEKEMPSDDVDKNKYVLIPVWTGDGLGAVAYEHGEIGDLVFVDGTSLPSLSKFE